MILYSDKCHYMCLRKDAVSDLLQLSGEEVKESEPETVLGIEIYNKLNFESHIKTLCSKASQKLGALQRISNLLGTQKKTLLFNIITKSQSSCCPLRSSSSLVVTGIRDPYENLSTTPSMCIHCFHCSIFYFLINHFGLVSSRM